MLAQLWGCASDVADPAPPFHAEHTPIAFDRPEFASGPTRLDEKTIDWPDGSVGRSIVARFGDMTEGAWAEIVYAAQHDSVLGSRTSVEGEVGWLYPSEPLFWYARGTVEAPWGVTLYRLLSMPYRRMSCVGFSSGWNRAQNDPLRLPRERLAGVYCRPEAAPVDEMSARRNRQPAASAASRP